MMPVTSPRSWPQRLVELGRRRTQVLITAFSVAGSVFLVSIFYVAFGAPRDDVVAFFLPALVVPLVVAPLASTWVVQLAFELVHAHRTMATQAAQLEALFLAAPLGIVELDPRGGVRRRNAMAATMLGDAGTCNGWAPHFTEPAQWAALDAAVREGQALEARWTWRALDDEPVVLHAHLSPLPAEAGGGAILMVADVTMEEAMEAERRRREQLALVGRLSAGLAHDFNNLLTVVRANVAALRVGSPVEFTAPLTAIDESAAAAARLTRRLLAISGRAQHAPVRQPLAPILEETVHLMDRLAPPGVMVGLDAPLPAVAVLVDRDGVQQALLNLLLNARDAVQARGHLRVAASVRSRDGRDWVAVSVRDDGPGMPPDVLAHATEPFFTTKASHEGTGLGLSLVRDAMTAHGGILQLESTPGHGTTATLWLPDPAPLCEAPAPAAPTIEAGRLVLVVDDEAVVRDATAMVLRHLGYTVQTVASAAEARAYLEETPVALLITDVMMPGETGLDLLCAVRASGAPLPVLLVSGYSAEAVEAVVAADPAAAFLAKPWTIEDLRAQLHTLLDPEADATDGSGDDSATAVAAVSSPASGRQ